MSAAWGRVHAWRAWSLTAAIWSLFVWWLLLAPTPLVSRTWPDGACVTVEPPSFSCDALPARYEVRWVAPEAGR